LISLFFWQAASDNTKIKSSKGQDSEGWK
jgi:hypothetical protein